MNSESTWNFVKGLSTEPLWIGGYCSDTSHNRCKQPDMAYWFWTDGTPFTSAFMKWYSHQPDTGAGMQDKLVMNYRAHGHWDDEFATKQLPFICQADPSGIGKAKKIISKTTSSHQRANCQLLVDLGAPLSTFNINI